MQHWEAEFVWIADTVLQQSSDMWLPIRDRWGFQEPNMVSVVRHSWGCGGEYSVVSVFCNSKYSNSIQACTSFTSHWTSQSTRICQGGGGKRAGCKNIGMEWD